MEPILILTTGGTIDTIYFDAKSTYEVSLPHISRLLEELNLSIEFRVVSVPRKDSLDLTDDDRRLVYQHASVCSKRQVLITHGTDTMVETGKTPESLSATTIVSTGALEPALFKASDALFNIGCARGASQTLDSSVFIAMSGRVFRCRSVRRNLQTNRFESLEP